MHATARSGLVAFSVIAAALGGCTKSKFDLVEVTGSVKHPDGSVPEGGMRLVRFEPIVPPNGRTSAVATAQVQDDGSFKASTLKPNDGAMPGEYKVVLFFWKSPADRTPQLPKQYDSAGTTPLPTVSVQHGTKNHFDLLVERRLVD